MMSQDRVLSFWFTREVGLAIPWMGFRCDCGRVNGARTGAAAGPNPQGPACCDCGRALVSAGAGQERPSRMPEAAEPQNGEAGNDVDAGSVDGAVPPAPVPESGGDICEKRRPGDGGAPPHATE